MLAAAFLAVLLAGACAPREPLKLIPDGAPPGESVVVRVPILEPVKEPGSIKITVGEQAATVLKVEPPTGVEFLVPQLPQGLAKVIVRIDEDEVGHAHLEIRPSPALQLVLSMTGSEITLVSSRGTPSLGRGDRESAEKTGLAYDVLTAEGALVATGSMRHPLADRIEVFEPDGKMHRAPQPDSATFTLRIPSIAGPAIVRFYEYEVGVNLNTKKGRSKRRLVSEIKLGGQ